MGNKVRSIFRWNITLLIAAILILLSCGGAVGESAQETVYHIVVLSDAHMPVIPRDKPKETPTDKAAQSIDNLKIETAKNHLIANINGWNDVTRFVALGDMVGSYGSDAEYAASTSFFGKLNKPVSYIAGNHDYIYVGRQPKPPMTANPDPNQFEFIRGTPQQRKEKLNRFQQEYKQSELYYTQEYGKYLLVFLSTDSLDSKRLCEYSQEQMSWLQDVLSANPNRPTIIFAHAPLFGTLEDYNSLVNEPSFIALPEIVPEALRNGHKIEEPKPGTIEFRSLLKNNPQVFMWISGHTHTAATNKSFASGVNLYDGRVHDVQNPTLNGEIIWTNSIYLYPDKVVVRTYRHSDNQWLTEFDREFPVE